jgi:hypothetical protein
MLTRRTLMLGAAFAAASTPLRATDVSALGFVTEIYNGYKGNDSPGHALDSEPVIRRYFEPSLAALMVKDQNAAAKRGEVGLLDFDPFVDAQEWEISDFDIAVNDTAPGKASATVKFHQSRPAHLGHTRSRHDQERLANSPYHLGDRWEEGYLAGALCALRIGHWSG